jgi:hypothetical protein
MGGSRALAAWRAGPRTWAAYACRHCARRGCWRDRLYAARVRRGELLHRGHA